MKEIIDAIASQNRHRLVLELHHYSDRLDRTEEDLIDLINLLPAIVDKFDDVFIVEDEGQKIVWYNFENLI